MGGACRVVAANTEPIPLRIAINASISELGDPEYVHRVAAAVAKHGIDPERIAIEVTEEIFDRDEESVLTGLRRLKEIGVHVAIDDFGSGYSSLRWLDHYPVNTLKIDAAFIATVTDEHQSVPVLEGTSTTVLATGYGELSDKLEEHGALDVLKKPYGRADLAEMLERLTG